MPATPVKVATITSSKISADLPQTWEQAQSRMAQDPDYWDLLSKADRQEILALLPWTGIKSQKQADQPEPIGASPAQAAEMPSGAPAGTHPIAANGPGLPRGALLSQRPPQMPPHLNVGSLRAPGISGGYQNSLPGGFLSRKA
jgi:hypothetical protein